jgi:hypothetical protein
MNYFKSPTHLWMLFVIFSACHKDPDIAPKINEIHLESKHSIQDSKNTQKRLTNTVVATTALQLSTAPLIPQNSGPSVSLADFLIHYFFPSKPETTIQSQVASDVTLETPLKAIEIIAHHTQPNPIEEIIKQPPTPPRSGSWFSWKNIIRGVICYYVLQYYFQGNDTPQARNYAHTQHTLHPSNTNHQVRNPGTPESRPATQTSGTTDRTRQASPEDQRFWAQTRVQFSHKISLLSAPSLSDRISQRQNRMTTRSLGLPTHHSTYNQVGTGCENIMDTSINQSVRGAINRIDSGYAFEALGPTAIHSAATEALDAIEHLYYREDTSSKHKARAALLALDYLLTTTDTEACIAPINSPLKMIEVFSLLWKATLDSRRLIDTGPSRVRNAKQALVSSLADSQSQGTQDRNGRLNYEHATLGSRCCATGFLVRMVDSLNHMHADILLTQYTPTNTQLSEFIGNYLGILNQEGMLEVANSSNLSLQRLLHQTLSLEFRTLDSRQIDQFLSNELLENFRDHVLERLSR